MNIPMQEIEAERIGMDPMNIGTTQEEYEALDGDISRKEKKGKKKKFVRMAAGETWEDPTLGEWDTGTVIWLLLLRLCYFNYIILYI